MAQLVRAFAPDAFGSWFTSRPGHTYNKDLNYEIISLWYKISKVARSTFKILEFLKFWWLVCALAR